ncbi:TlpA family protein disulfide reductase [Fibrella aquatilis]|uniref:DUF5106 domain-containing protein n=1 Tax=Fibrella aquatilis TaxID=2817059 RepID=A0A939K0V4_9BACT|nr:TlpA family protein disulfide reductase [Fibrella aquatilis]MBO0934584.1 DUF5106 domain-containing protein [Fibrella aquatilis]
MNLRNLVWLVLGLMPGLVVAQTPAAQSTAGHRIAGRVKGLADTTVILAHYQYDATHYVPKDTARVDAAGNFVFQGKKPLPGGLYLVVMPKGQFFDLMVVEQQFSFETDTADSGRKNMKVTGSPENIAFYEYQHRLRDAFDGMRKLDKQPKSEAITQQLRALQKEAGQYRTDFLVKNDKLFTTKILRASADPEIPTPPKAANGRPDSIWQFNYYKNHYWDNFDFSDDRMLRTSMIQPKIDRYLKELTVQQVDSLTKEADFLVKKASANKDVKSYVIWYITSQYERPKVLGTDGLFVHMIEKYWLTKELPGIDSATLKSVSERVAVLKPLQVGKPLPLPAVGDTLARPINLVTATQGAAYTVFFFYAPHCGHCREAAPKLKAFADSPEGKGVKVVAIAIEDNVDDWKKFIREFKLTSWVNGYDHKQQIDFRRQYDVFTTPTIYVLDKNRAIIARALPVEQVADFLNFTRKQAAATAAPKSVGTAKAVAPKASGK